MLRIGQVESTAQDGKYTDGNVASGISATRLRAAAFNAMQEELANIIEEAGNELDASDDTQVLTALKQIFSTLSTTGNAATATKLATARTIGGVSFDGTANINLPGVNASGTQATSGNAATATKLATARTINGVAFDGTANITVTATADGGAADTATKLATARTIGGVSFDGTANINLPGVNAAGSQATTGNAATATKLATARKINGVPFDGSADISVNTLVSRGLVPALSGNDQGTPGIQLYEAYNNGYPIPYGNVIHLKGASAGGEGELLMGWIGTSGAHAPLYIRSRRDFGSAPWSAWAQVFTANELAGIPLPFPGEDPPSGWLKCKGQIFNKTTYPVLASLYPTGKLPDLRGEFIRGWDDGRGVDTGRSLLSAQNDAMQPITAKWVLDDMAADGAIDYPPSGALYIDSTATVNFDAVSTRARSGARGVFDSSLQTRTANETRPRNIAFNYIVRAA